MEIGLLKHAEPQIQTMCALKPGGQNWTNLSEHALRAYINQNLKCHTDWCKWAWPITYLIITLGTMCYLLITHTEFRCNLLKGVQMVEFCSNGAPPEILACKPRIVLLLIEINPLKFWHLLQVPRGASFLRCSRYIHRGSIILQRQ